MRDVFADFEVDILVSSCDEFSDTWEPFFQLLWRYWPDCPYPVYLNAVTKPCTLPRVRQILVGSRLSWGDGILKALDFIQKTSPKTKYLLLLLDDYLIDRKVDASAIRKAIEFLDAMDGQYLRLFPKPPPDKPLPECDVIGKISRRAPYRASLQAALWRMDVLKDLVRREDTPWDVEVLGSQRSKCYDGFYSTYRPLISYLNGIERGKWTSDALRFLVAEQIDVNMALRPNVLDARGSPNSFSDLLADVKHLIPLQTRLFIRTLFVYLTGKRNR